MAMAMDHSKCRNPDMPLGYMKKEPELIYKEGIEIDGVHYVWAPYIYEARLEEREDVAELSDLGFMSESEEEISQTIKELENNTGKEKRSLKSQSDIRGKEVISIKKEPCENDSSASKHGKKYDDSDTSAINTSLSYMDIDDSKNGKTKTKKIKKEHKSGYRSVSSSPSPTHRHHSSTSHHRKHSPSQSRKHDSPTSRRHSSPTSRRHPSPTSRRHSSPSSHRYPSPSNCKRERIVALSPSSSPEPYLDIKIKEEASESAQHLFGSYICEVCNITMNSFLTFQTHINGRRHRKNLKVKNLPEAVAKSIPATVVSEDQSKYPNPPRGVIRKKVQIPAKIQHVLEAKIMKPCIGLNYVIEIQGIGGVQYYCSMCDSVCSSDSISSHLTGYKHQLNSLKFFKPQTYESMQFQPKYRIEKQLQSLLRAVQKKEGMGRMAVEIEELAPDSKIDPQRMNEPSASRDYRSLPSTSRGPDKDSISMTFQEKYDKSILPEKQTSDFFCDICQSHMNSLQMWEAHIRGKRHLTNVKKNPGDLPSKTKTIQVKKRAILLDRIKKECPQEPFVGLSEVRETKVDETNSYSYQCFLCGSCQTSIDIIEHLISLKHRTKYLNFIDFPGREVISGMSDTVAYSLVKDMCAQVEAVQGTGQPAVHVNKSSLYY